MANHEMNIKCKRCGEVYDRRLRDTCPQCREREAYWNNFRDILRGMGFQTKEYFDRDFSDFDNIKVVDYRKDLTHDCAIVYSEYHTADAPGEFVLKEQAVELLVEDSSVQLLFGETSVQLLFGETSDFLKVYAILNKYIKR